MVPMARPTMKIRRRNVQKRRENRFVITALAPILILFAAFYLYPLFSALFLSLSKYNPLSGSIKLIGIGNFSGIFSEEVFIKSILNTFKFVIITIPLNIILSLLIAVAISSIPREKLKNLFRTTMFLPIVAPSVGSVLVWSMIYRYPNGLMNNMISLLGFDPFYWLTNLSTAMFSVIMMTIWADIGYNIVLFIVGLNTVPEMFYEAARLDGASRFRMFWHVTLPLLSRTTLFVSIMTMFSYFQEFTRFQLLTNGEPLNSTLVMSLQIYRTAFQYFDMSKAASMATVLFVIMLLITLIQMKAGKSQWEY